MVRKAKLVFDYSIEKIKLVTKPNLQDPMYQNLLNQIFCLREQTEYTKPNLLNQIYQTKPTKQDMDVFGPIWNLFDLYGPMCAYLDLNKPIWTFFGPIWTNMGGCGPPWTFSEFMNLFLPIRTYLKSFCPFWTYLNQYGYDLFEHA